MTARSINFALVREGPSDDGLITHLRDLIVQHGADEAVGSSRRYTGPTEARLRSVLDEPGKVDIIFVHRDSDSRQADQRHEEVRVAAEQAGALCPVVAVVPIQELEAWLLVDEGQIRQVAGRPSGRENLSLPTLSRIEKTASPKEVLENALLAASAKTGRRREKEKKNFSEYRRRLLERLDIHGDVTKLTGWKKLEADIHEAVQLLMATPEA